jgi:hypothetical protein
MFRIVALAVGALSIAGVALVGASTSASADPGRQPQRDRLCVELSNRFERERDCGREASVELDNRARSIGVMSPGRRTCVIVGRDRDCSQGWSRASARRAFDEVRIYVEGLYFCGRLGAEDDSDGIRCSTRRGWLHLEADDDVDSITLWIPRRQPRR